MYWKRATLGDVSRVDHTEVTMGTRKYVVLTVLDVASSLLAAFPLKTLSAHETLNNLREWTATYQRTIKRRMC